MIIDTLDHLGRYTGLHPLFPQIARYLKTADLNAVGAGTKVELKGEELVVNFSQTEPKTREEARLETHERYIDIQIPLSGTETIGYTPRANLPGSVYDPAGDIAFYEGEAESYLCVKPGMFVIFWPEDGHAPAISGQRVKKIVVKVLV